MNCASVILQHKQTTVRGWATHTSSDRSHFKSPSVTEGTKTTNKENVSDERGLITPLSLSLSFRTPLPLLPVSSQSLPGSGLAEENPQNSRSALRGRGYCRCCWHTERRERVLRGEPEPSIWGREAPPVRPAAAQPNEALSKGNTGEQLTAS